jgi:hypothetical protein
VLGPSHGVDGCDYGDGGGGVGHEHGRLDSRWPGLTAPAKRLSTDETDIAISSKEYFSKKRNGLQWPPKKIKNRATASKTHNAKRM